MSLRPISCLDIHLQSNTGPTVKEGVLYLRQAHLELLILPTAKVLRMTLRIRFLVFWSTKGRCHLLPQQDWLCALQPAPARKGFRDFPWLLDHIQCCVKRLANRTNQAPYLSHPRWPSELFIYSNSVIQPFFKKINLYWLISHQPLTAKLPDAIGFLLVFFCYNHPCLFTLIARNITYRLCVRS